MRQLLRVEYISGDRIILKRNNRCPQLPLIGHPLKPHVSIIVFLIYRYRHRFHKLFLGNLSFRVFPLKLLVGRPHRVLARSQACRYVQCKYGTKLLRGSCAFLSTETSSQRLGEAIKNVQNEGSCLRKYRVVQELHSTSMLSRYF